MTVEALIRERLAPLAPTLVELIDDSARHAGHAGAGGGGHYRLVVVSPQFAGHGTLKRHRMVYDALGTMMRHEIHAISIIARTPDEPA